MSQNPFSGLPQFEPQPAESPAPRRPGRPPKVERTTVKTLSALKQATALDGAARALPSVPDTTIELDMLADIAARLNALPAPQRQRIVKALGRMYP